MRRRRILRRGIGVRWRGLRVSEADCALSSGRWHHATIEMRAMPNQQDQPVPNATTITPALLKTHSITQEEYARIEAALGRVPSLTELGIFSVMWSEHCTYKSSRVHLKRLPTRGDADDRAGQRGAGAGGERGHHRCGRWLGVCVQDRDRTIIRAISSRTRARLRVWAGFCGTSLR